MTRPDSALRFLYSLQSSGIKAGLGSVRFLLSILGNPERSYPAVHVAGTNGKGSVSAMIAACLTSAGYRTGLYTSPHLVDFTERIRVDGRKISPRRVAAYARLLRSPVRETRATFFDATTAIAFRHFADEGVDIAVIETGLGGRWDSTNVITPLVSVITTIGLEHREYLGRTIPKIAFEKAGIIKPGVPVIVGNIAGAALGVIARRAADLRSPVIRAFRATTVSRPVFDVNGLTATFNVGGRTLGKLFVGAGGAHQAGNARIALVALRTLRSLPPLRTHRPRADSIVGRFTVDERALRRGFSSPGELAGLKGRLQPLRRDPLVIADVAHNPDGVRALVSSLRGIHAGKFRMVFGVMMDKEYRAMIESLGPLARMLYFVRAGTDRSRDTRDLVGYAHSRGVPARVAGSVARGISLAIDENRGLDPILITGSHYVVGEALGALGMGV